MPTFLRVSNRLIQTNWIHKKRMDNDFFVLFIQHKKLSQHGHQVYENSIQFCNLNESITL